MGQLSDGARVKSASAPTAKRTTNDKRESVLLGADLVGQTLCGGVSGRCGCSGWALLFAVLLAMICVKAYIGSAKAWCRTMTRLTSGTHKQPIRSIRAPTACQKTRGQRERAREVTGVDAAAVQRHTG